MNPKLLKPPPCKRKKWPNLVWEAFHAAAAAVSKYYWVEKEEEKEMALNKMSPPSACCCVCLSVCGGVTKRLRGKVILRLWLCQPATNPHTKLSWPEADCLSVRLSVCLSVGGVCHSHRHLNPYARFVGLHKRVHTRKPLSQEQSEKVAVSSASSEACVLMWNPATTAANWHATPLAH